MVLGQCSLRWAVVRFLVPSSFRYDVFARSPCAACAPATPHHPAWQGLPRRGRPQSNHEPPTCSQPSGPFKTEIAARAWGASHAASPAWPSAAAAGEAQDSTSTLVPRLQAFPDPRLLRRHGRLPCRSRPPGSRPPSRRGSRRARRGRHRRSRCRRRLGGRRRAGRPGGSSHRRSSRAPARSRAAATWCRWCWMRWWAT